MSSLKDLASLIMIPSLVKDGRLDTVKPLGNSIIHPDATGNNDGTDGSTPAEGNFTFTRCGGAAGCDLAATRVDVNGLIEKGRENIATYSEDATNGVYTKSNISVTANNDASPIGTATADTLTATANGATLQGVVTAVNGRVYTMSVYIKRRTGTGQVALRGINNLTTNITITNAWQRYEVFMVSNSTNGRYGVYLATSGDEVDVWGFQLEESLVATDYIETGASTAQAGILEDLPRLDYSGGASCPSLLLEPQRTNRLANSENGYGWTTSNVSVLPFDGGINGKYFQLTSAGSASRFNVIQNNWVNLAAATYTASVFAKKGTADEIILTTRANFASQSAYSTFNLTSGTVANNGVTGSIEPYSDGWYRCSITFTNPGSYTDFASFAYGFNFNASSTDTLFVTAPQSEIGSYPTSYIPTYGSAVTRSAENNVLGTPISLDSDFCLFWEGAVFEDDIMLYGSGTNAWYMNYTTSTGRIILDESSGRKVQAYLGSGTATGVRTKIMIRRQGGVHNVFANGAKLTNNTSVNSTTTLSLSSMFWAFSSAFYKGLEVNQSLVFETALTDSECIALTTI